MTTLRYKDAGVDIDAGNELVERIKPLVKDTNRPGVMQNIGGFGALFELPTNYKEPVLVSGTDGVGTKLKLALELNNHKTIGIDLVAMCVNDLIVQGAEPLFFLDYYATSSLNLEVATEVIAGIAEGCKLSGAALIGGETAEMPGIYSKGDYDLAGFCTGVVEKSKIIDCQSVKPGDTLIALCSSGAHSNGYSLIRKIITTVNADLSGEFEDNKTLGEVLLEPTKIYVKSLLKLFKEINVKAVAHITGGGLTENIPRVLPNNCDANIDQSSWEWAPIFKWLQSNGNVNHEEMIRTFNCGVGMILVIDKNDTDICLSSLKDSGELSWVIGDIKSGSNKVNLI